MRLRIQRGHAIPCELSPKPGSALQVQYLHPKDGVYPEKVNAGRTAVNANPRRIGANPNPVSVSHPFRDLTHARGYTMAEAAARNAFT